jgi:hypothetical protein
MTIFMEKKKMNKNAMSGENEKNKSQPGQYIFKIHIWQDREIVKQENCYTKHTKSS